MAWWNFLTGGVAELVKAGTGVVTAVAGDQAAKDQQLSTEQIALLNAYGAEFVARQQRSPGTRSSTASTASSVPALALGAQAAFVWAALDPVGFAEVMRVLAIVPDPLWVIWGGIWAFYFTGRIAEKLPKKWKIEPKAIEIAKEVAAERAARRQARRRRGRRNRPRLRRRRCRRRSPNWRIKLPPIAQPPMTSTPGRSTTRPIRSGRWRRPSGARRAGSRSRARSPSPG